MRKVFLVVLMLAIPATVMAQAKPGRVESDKIESGEGGYRLGCAAARSAGSKACEELYEKNQLQKIDEKKEQERTKSERKSSGDSGGARRAD